MKLNFVTRNLLWLLISCGIAATIVAAEDVEDLRSTYSKTRENKRYEGKVVKKIDSSSLVSCGRACLRHHWCTSTNFREPFGKSRRGNCELNRHHFSLVDDKLTEQPGTTYTMFLKVRKYKRLPI